MSPAEKKYISAVEKLEIQDGDFWEERFILALVANNLMLCSEPMAGYHICAPMPRMGSIIGWEHSYLVERP